MRALLIETYGPVDSHRIQEVADPSPQSGHVIVRVRAVGLNYPDALMLQGKYQIRPEPPFVPGRDCAGEIVAVGPDVSEFTVGDRVVAQVFSGAFAELVPVPVERLFKLPDGLSYADAAGAITVFNTAYVATVLRACLKPGERVLITGAAGGVGLAATQLCTMLGGRVTAAVSTDEKADLCRANGAVDILKLTDEDPDALKDAFKEAARQFTGGKGYEIVIDTVGGDVFTAGLRALGFAGRMIVVGFASGRISETRMHYILYNNLAILGAPLDIHFARELERMRAAVSHWTTMMARGALSSNITERLPFEAIGDAFRRILERKTKGKIVLEID